VARSSDTRAFYPMFVHRLARFAIRFLQTSSRGDSPCVAATGVTIPSRFTLGNDFLASATARLGYSYADRWLVFVRGGAAWTREKTDIAFTNLAGIPVDPSATTNRTGWTVGTGVDWAFAPHWSANLEYNYYDFGDHSATLTSPANTTVVTVPSLKDTIHVVTAGVDYHPKFGSCPH
jgi:outer membrane immunogenic protein